MKDATPEIEDADRAALALKGIARDESIKAYILSEPNLRAVLLRSARRFIGGEQLEECLTGAQSFNSEGFAVTIDYMGESTRDEQIAREAVQEFETVIDSILRWGLDSSVSLDLSHIGLAVDEELCYSQAYRLAERARRAGLEMMISMEGSERTEQVLSIYHRLAERFENVGVTLQVYLRRTPEDMEAVLKHPGRIRLVKGAFEEPEEATIMKGVETDAAYRSCVERVLSEGHPCSISTHDQQLLEHADRFVRDNELSTDNIEFEMLKGVELERLARMRDLGYGARVYLPYGEEWYLYLCHRLAEHPPNIYQAISDAADVQG
ncbi:proline dehydrogenase family protein [Rubrobacter aplysinae]|uniref:proline dehydrogenase family protein n=1 Tax=Rubrobacter aplysinae TaxID=909625 RepID=UPI00064C17D6|nr:proline dehydrogenase family protein [Rubrobacter aplysinae]